MNNIILKTDGYKPSQWKQYPEGTTEVYSYIESRGGMYDNLVFFGLQAFIKKYMTQRITMQDINEAETFFEAYYGRKDVFNREGWEYIYYEHEGLLPVEIKAVPEGTVIGTKQVLATIVNTDPKCFWLTSYLETMLLRAVWYPTTVASRSKEIKNIITHYLNVTSSLPAKETINFKLHDFGARGVSSGESAEVGGAAHLVNFWGSDTLEGIMCAKMFYGQGETPIGVSIPASEHSTITSWGKDWEIDAYRNMINQFGSGIFACVSDSYDIWKALEMWKELEPEIIKSGGTLVVRPDSGDPVETPVEVVKRLIELFGCTVNEKGYKVLPDYIRVIQGDGINENSVGTILAELVRADISADNIAFGMGGQLLQGLDRDTQKFAMKCSNVIVSGESRYVFKDPVTDPGKTSKKGKFAVVSVDGEYKTMPKGSVPSISDQLKTVFRDGVIETTYTFDEVRANSMR